MRKYFLLISLFVLMFFAFSASNVSAGLGPCNTCTPSITDPCDSTYASGNYCYYGITCKGGSVHFAKNYCMSTSIAGTDTSNTNRYYCFDGTSTYDGYANMDSSNPVTDTQCQNKVCGSSGWYKTNKLDGTSCTGGLCQSGVCKLPLTGCTDGTLEGACSSANPGKRCVSGSLVADATCASVCTTCPDGTAVGSCSSVNVGKKCVSSGGTCQLQTDITCAGGGTACSGWSNMGDCNGDRNCHWCSSINSCALYSESCPIADNCNIQTSQSACDAQSGNSFNFDCGWCPNSYNGGTSANGGSCIKAENLAAECGV